MGDKLKGILEKQPGGWDAAHPASHPTINIDQCPRTQIGRTLPVLARIEIHQDNSAPSTAIPLNCFQLSLPHINQRTAEFPRPGFWVA